MKESKLFVYSKSRVALDPWDETREWLHLLSFCWYSVLTPQMALSYNRLRSSDLNVATQRTSILHVVETFPVPYDVLNATAHNGLPGCQLSMNASSNGVKAQLCSSWQMKLRS